MKIDATGKMGVALQGFTSMKDVNFYEIQPTGERGYCVIKDGRLIRTDQFGNPLQDAKQPRPPAPNQSE